MEDTSNFFTMKRKLFTVIIICLYIIVNSIQVAVCSVPETKKTVYVFELKQEISKSALRLIKKTFEEAKEKKADIIIMRLDTYGGELDAADKIHTLILNSKIPVYVLIEGNAASAGALISISCDSIYMKGASTIGAASVVNQNGEIMPDKYQSYMRGMMRATAQQRGRNPKIAEGMVTPNGYLKNIADTGKIITLTTEEAIRYGYCDGKAENIQEVLQLAHITDYTEINYEPTVLDAIIRFLTNPLVNSILLLIIMAGIYFEFQHPGIGFPLFAAITAAILYFAPLYLDGLAANWEILLFIVGVILLLVEIFVIPGFGVTGILGIILIVTGLTLSLVNNQGFDFSFVGWDKLVFSMSRVVVILAAGILAGIFFGKRILGSSVMKKVVLTDTMESTTGFTDSPRDLEFLIQKTGMALTDLRPSGAVDVNGEKYDAVAEGGYVHKEEKVRVTAIRGNYLVVRKNDFA